MLRGLDDIGLTVSYQSEGIGELLTQMIDNKKAEFDKLNNTCLLFSKYEKELERYLVNRDRYFKNNVTNQKEIDEACQFTIDANRQTHFDFLRQKLVSNERYGEAALLL